MTNKQLLDVLKEIRELASPTDTTKQRGERSEHENAIDALRQICNKADSAIKRAGEVWQRQREQ